MGDSSPNTMIRSGACHVLFAYDIGLGIDLEAAARRITEAIEPETIRHKRRVPSALEFRPTPLRVFQSGEPVQVASFATSERVECVVYDFGAVSVAYSIPLAGPLEGLLGLSDSLYENAALLADSRRRVERLVAGLGAAVTKPHIADFVEDYAVYQIESMGDDSPDTAAVIAAHRPTLARILRAEPSVLSGEEVDDALSCRMSYQPGSRPSSTGTPRCCSSARPRMFAPCSSMPTSSCWSCVGSMTSSIPCWTARTTPSIASRVCTGSV